MINMLPWSAAYLWCVDHPVLATSWCALTTGPRRAPAHLRPVQPTLELQLPGLRGEEDSVGRSEAAYPVLQHISRSDRCRDGKDLERGLLQPSDPGLTKS